MFDEKPNAPQEVVDMFEGGSAPRPPAPTPAASPLLTPPPLRTPVPPSPVSAMDGGASAPHTPGFGVVKSALIFAVVLALIGGAGYAAWRMMSQTPAADGPVRSVSNNGIVAPGDDEEVVDDDTDTSITDGMEETDTNTQDEPEAKTSLIDSDGDGLTNAEELEAGTKVNEADTDSDGLGDREEVKVYGTNPRKADTDGDSFLDGQEVAGGYNPNGNGRLFNVPNP